MPAVAPPPAKVEAEVQGRLAQAARRIRTHDVLFGVSLLAATSFAYLAAVVTLDHAVELPDWARQIGLLGLLAALGAVGYRWVARPLQRQVNPLYAARQVERTVEDAKNGVINWVDLKDRDLPESVRSAVGARAAKQLREADLEATADPKRLVWGGAVVLALTVVLAVLFLVYRPSVFLSLTGRALNPFAGTGIATRTQITLTTPADGNATVTSGDPVVIGVSVGGRVPDAESPDHMRVKIRHNPESPDFEEVPLEPAGTARDWQVRLPQHLILSGFWYTVAGGDGETPEYRVTVRPRPRFDSYEVRYEYPAYLRMPAETSTLPALVGYRGTTVTIMAKANRELKDGRAVHSAGTAVGEVVGEARDALRVKFTLTDQTAYQLLFKSVGGESNADSARLPILVLQDAAPTVTLTTPDKDEVTVPLNGQIAVDAKANDDFGLDTLALRLALPKPNGPAEPLGRKPYQGGKSFKRAEDGTFPNAVEYKDSLPLAEVKDEKGRPVALKEGMVLEVWVEAIDNCTEPGANVGESKHVRVKVGPPVEPAKQPDQKKAADNRKQQEAAHQQDQQQKLQQEKRPENVPPQQNRDPNAKPDQPQEKGEGDPMNGQPQAGEQPKAGEPMAGQPMPMGGQQPSEPKKNGDQPQSPPDPNNPPMGTEPPKVGEPQPKTNTPPKAGEGQPTAKPMPGDPGQGGEPQTQPGGPKPPTPEQQKLDNEAKRVQDQLREQQRQEMRQAEKDLTSPDDAKRQAAEKKLDDTIGQPQRERMQQLQKDLKSDNPETRKKAEEQLSQLQREFDKGGEADSKPKGQEQADYLSRELQKAANDMQSKNPDQQKAGQDRMDQLVGKENRPQAEQMNKDRQDQDELKKKEAQKQFVELRKKAEEKQQADTKKAAEDMASNDPGQQAAGQKQVDQTVGEENRKQAEQLAKDLKSPDAATRQAAEKKLDQMRQQANEQKGRPSDEQMQQMEQSVKDLAGNDEGKKQQAREQLDKMVGPEARKQAEQDAKQLADDLQSGDKQREQAAKQKLDQMRDRLQREAGKNMESEQKKANDADTLSREEMKQAMQDMASGDKGKQDEAKRKLDEKLGPQQRQELEKKADQLNKDLQSQDQATKNAAEQQLDELRKKPQPNAGGKADDAKQKEFEKAAQDMASNDPKQQEAGRKKMDELIGEKNRKAAEQQAKQMADDLQSKDEKTRQAAEQKLKDMQQQAGANAPKPDSKQAEQDRKDMEQIAKDMASGDPKKQQEARDKLDQKIGEQARKQAEQEAKQLLDDLQSKDEGKRQAAQKKLDDIRKQMEQMAKDQKGQQPTPEQIEQWKKAAQDLNSKDETTRKKAEETLDKELGQPAREQMQQEMQKQADKPGEEQAKRAEEMAKRAAEERAKRSGGGDGGGAPDKAMEANKEYAKRAADLALESKRTLDQLKKAKDDAELMKKLGYTPADYERFLKGYEQRAAELAKEAETAAKAPPPTKPGETKVTQRRVDDAGTVKNRKGEAGPTGPGLTNAPPGYGKAQERFNQGGASDKR